MNNIDNSGCYVCQRILSLYGYKVGDILEFSLYGKKDIYRVKIVGDVYSLSEGIFMSSEAIKNLDISYSIDTIYTDSLKKDIINNDDIISIYSKDDIIKTFDTFTTMLIEMIVLLVLFSSLLAFVVLYNLGTMSYLERYRELATL